MFEEMLTENKELAPKYPFYIFGIILLVEFLEFLFRAGFTVSPERNAEFVKEFLTLDVLLKYFVVVAAISIINAFIRKSSFGEFIKKSIFIIACSVLLVLGIHLGFPALAELAKITFNINIYNGQWLSMALIMSFEFALFYTTEPMWEFIYKILSASYDKEAYQNEIKLSEANGFTQEQIKAMGYGEEEYENHPYIQKTKYLKMAKNPLKPIF